MGAKLNYPVITSDQETIDPKVESSRSRYDSNGNQYYYKKESYGHSITIKPKNSFFSIQKEFFENGSIKSKGILFLSSISFKVGIWYFFDPTGKVIEKLDTDAVYTFSLDKVFEFIDQNKIEHPRKNNIHGDGGIPSGGTWISRVMSESSSTYGGVGPIWIVNKAVGNGVFQYYLDGKTGKQLKTYEAFEE